MRQLFVYALLLVLFFCTSCGQTSTDAAKEKGRSKTNSPGFYKQYEYADASGARLVLQSGLPRCGARFKARNGEEYSWVVFWSRIINETGNRLDLNIEFPVDEGEDTSSSGNYFKVLVPPDTMTIAKMPLYNYGLQDMDSFLDTSIQKSFVSLKRSVDPRDSTGFLVVVLSRLHNVQPNANLGFLRAALSLKESSLFYTISLFASKPELPLIGETGFGFGSVNWKGEEMK